MSCDVLLQMENICKEFPGVQALDHVSLKVRAGTVHALMGENGAGKSTLMKCLFGIYSKSSGRIFLEGKEVSFKNPKDALEHGVAMVHQELNQALKRNVMVEKEINPDNKISRLDFCRITAKAKGITLQPDSNPFTDTDDKAVLALYKAGVIGGMSANTFCPDETLTRGQIAKIIYFIDRL